MELRPNIYSVGVVDSDVRVFHGYETPVGTTYNSYLIIDDKITLIDFVKKGFEDEFLQNIEGVLGDRKIDYMICNHVEPDHSGAFPAVIEKYPEAIVYGTMQCQKSLHAYYPTSTYEFKGVKGGDTLNTGKNSFQFIPVPMVHWPDNMVTYMVEEEILFSNDALGQHNGTGTVIDEDDTLERLLYLAGDYYANIVLPFNPQVQKVMAQVAQLKISMVCPSHGVILKKYIGEMVAKYNDWSQNKLNDKKMIIVYDTMWGTTAKLAQKYYDEYVAKGFEVELISLGEKHHSYAMAQILDAKYVFVGSPTLNNGMMPTVSAFLTYMKGLKPKNRIGKAFGSYGWSGESVKDVEKILEDTGFELLESERVQWNF